MANSKKGRNGAPKVDPKMVDVKFDSGLLNSILAHLHRAGGAGLALRDLASSITGFAKNEIYSAISWLRSAGYVSSIGKTRATTYTLKAA